jgi:hypothetical protein
MGTSSTSRYEGKKNFGDGIPSGSVYEVEKIPLGRGISVYNGKRQ